MERDEIKKILPHREPMLLIDEANLLDEATAEGFTQCGAMNFFCKDIFQTIQ